MKPKKIAFGWWKTNLGQDVFKIYYPNNEVGEPLDIKIYGRNNLIALRDALNEMFPGRA